MSKIVRFLALHVAACIAFAAQAQMQEAKINDAAHVLGRIDLERISYALQTLEEKASIEGSVQLLNRIEEEYPRPVTARDVSVYVMVPEKTVTVRVGSDLKTYLPEERVAAIIREKMKPSLDQRNFSDAVVDVLNEISRIAQAEGGVIDQQQTENGKALALVIGICSATVLMFLWLILFMNRFVGSRLPLQPFLFRIVAAHAVALMGLAAAWVLEVEMGVGIVGMAVIPIVVLVQLALLFKVFRIVLPAVAKS